MNKKRNFSWKNFFSKWYILIILALIYIPLIFIIFLSFNEGSPIKGNINTKFGHWTVVNYLTLLSNPAFTHSLTASLIVASIVVPTSVILAVMVCFGMWSNWKGYSKLVLSISNISIAIPSVINGIALVILFTFTWIPMGFGFGYLTIIFAQVSFATPYAIVFIYPKLQKFDMNLLLASQDLGYTRIKTFWKIVFPYLLPSILLSSTIVFTQSFDDYVITSLVEGRVSVIAVNLYTMNKGIQVWAVTFGAIVMFITFFIVIVRTCIVASKEQIRKNKDKKIILQRMHKMTFNKIKLLHNKQRKELSKSV